MNGRPDVSRTSPPGTTDGVVGRGRRSGPWARRAGRLLVLSALAVMCLSPATASSAPGAPVGPAGRTAGASVAQTTTSAPEPDVAGKVVERAPSKVLADLEEMPRTGGFVGRMIAGAGLLVFGVGLLLVDAAGVRLRRQARR